MTPPGGCAADRAAAEPRPVRARTIAALFALPPLAAWLAFGGALDCGFVYDDVPALVENRALRAGDWWGAAFGAQHTPIANRPVPCLSFVLDHAWHGLEPRGYHLVNLILHAANSLLLFLVLQGTFRAPALRDRLRPALATAMALVLATAWAAHPLGCDAVAYVTQRSTLWMAFFALAAFGALLASRAAQHRRAWQAVTVACTALAMASKEDSVVLPILLILFERAFAADSWAALRPRLPFYGALCATWLVLLGCVLGGPRNRTVGWATTPPASAWEWLLTEAPVVARYAHLAIWPDTLRGAYDFPIVRQWQSVVLPGLGVLVALAGSAALWRRHPAWGFLGASFFLWLAPTSSVLPIITEIAAERRMYLPMLAILVAVVAGAARLLGFMRADPPRMAPLRAAFALALATAVIAAAIVRTRDHVAVYRDATAFWTAAYRENELTNRSHLAGRILSSYGRILHDQGRTAEAHATLERAMACAAPTVVEQLNFANMRQEQGHMAEAEARFRAILRTDPDYGEAMGNLAQLLMDVPPPSGSAPDAVGLRLAEAERLLARAVEVSPFNAVLHNSMGVLLFRRGDARAALPHLQRATELDGGYLQAQTNLGIALLDLGRAAEAIATWRPLLAKLPRDADLRVRLAVAHHTTGEQAIAEAMLREALALAPDHAAAKALLAEWR